MTATVRAARARLSARREDDRLDRQFQLGALYASRLAHPHTATVRIVVAPARLQPCVPGPVIAQEDVLGGGYPRLEWDPITERWHYPL